MNNKMIKYSNGLRLVVEEMNCVKTVSAGIWIGVGSAYETQANNGIAHFTEHMLFKGTKRFSPFELADAFESIGAQVNAFTGKEYTCYYYKSIDEYFDRGMDVLTDLFFNSTLLQAEIDRERKVILEELHMVEDSPEDISYDVIAKCIYGEDSVGQTILGSAQNVSAFSPAQITEFMSKFYCPSNIVVSIAGNVTLAQADAMVKKYFLPNFKSHNSTFKYDVNYARPRHLSKIKDFEQANIALCFPTVRLDDPEFNTQALANVIIGGGMSSRLFQEVREKLGLAYSIYSAPLAYREQGTYNIFCNTSPTNTSKCVAAVKKVLLEIRDNGAIESEFVRAKAQLKSSLLFGQESVQTLMSTAGKLLIATDKVFDIDGKIAQINAITIDDVNTFIKKIFDFNKVYSSYVGKRQDAEISSLLQS